MYIYRVLPLEYQPQPSVLTDFPFYIRVKDKCMIGVVQMGKEEGRIFYQKMQKKIFTIPNFFFALLFTLTVGKIMPIFFAAYPRKRKGTKKYFCSRFVLCVHFRAKKFVIFVFFKFRRNLKILKTPETSTKKLFFCSNI